MRVPRLKIIAGFKNNCLSIVGSASNINSAVLVIIKLKPNL